MLVPDSFRVWRSGDTWSWEIYGRCTCPAHNDTHGDERLFACGEATAFADVIGEGVAAWAEIAREGRK